MLMTYSTMEGACQPRFQQPHDMMDARQEFGRRLFPPREDGNFVLIVFLLQTRVAFPAISVHYTAGLN
jgi:hypothetical protein